MASLILKYYKPPRPRWRGAGTTEKWRMEALPSGAVLIETGSFSRAYKLPHKDQVRKIPMEQYNFDTGENDYSTSLRALHAEIRIYRSIPPSPYLVAFYRATDMSIDLEYAPNGTVLDFVKKNQFQTPFAATIPPTTTPSRIATQTIQALAYIHSHGVIHRDLGARQLLLDADWNVRLIDFGGSSFKGQAGFGVENATHFMPRSADAPSTIRTDLFALGSTLFEILRCGRAPYFDRGSQEVGELFRDGVFPDVEECGRPWGDVILRCWSGEFESAAEVAEVVPAEIG
jgi:serine/threonine protein kinase